MRILLPFDGSRASERALRHVIDWLRAYEPLELHVVNVQQEAGSWQLERFLKKSEIRTTQQHHADACLAGARTTLDRAGIEYETHVLIGDPAERIARFAKRQRVDVIVMGTQGMTSMAGLFLGSVTMKVLHLTQVPVTLIR